MDDRGFLLLLNIGLRPDGSITDEEMQTLLGTGKWLDVNGEAIYGTRPRKLFGEGSTESASGSLVDPKKPFTSQDIRFTTNCDLLYEVALGVPITSTIKKSLCMPAANGTIASVELLGNTEKISWIQQAEALVIIQSKNYPSENAVVYKISFKK